LLYGTADLPQRHSGAQVAQLSAVPAQRVTEPPEPAPAARPNLWAGAAAAILLYALLRAATLAVLALYAAAEARHLGLRDVLGTGDAVWYQQIAAQGYDRAIQIGPDGGLTPSNLIFFPLFPGLTALVALVLPVGTAALVVSAVAGLAAAAGLYAVGAQVRDRRTGILLAGLFAVLPHALVQSMGYPETLFTALAAWTLLAVLRRRWLTAALLCVPAGLTLPASAVLIGTVVLAALVAIGRRPARWRPWLAVLIAPLGLLGWLVWVSVRLNRLDGWFYVRGTVWGARLDDGRYTLHALGDLVTGPSAVETFEVGVALLVAVVLLVAGIGARLPWPLSVFAAAALLAVLAGAGDFGIKERLLMPAFPLLLPVAIGLARARSRVTVIAVLLGLTAFSACLGAYLALVWNDAF
jgi:hypothetical protein